MAIQLQLRRGSAEDSETFIGAPGEVTVDTSKNTLRVHDGVTPGGHELAKHTLSNAIITKSLTPKISSQYDVGTSTYKWKNIHLSNSIFLNTIAINGNNNSLNIVTNSSETYVIDQSLSKSASPIFSGLTVTGTFNAINGIVGQANKLSTPRTISTTGDLTFSTVFDGSTNATAVATLKTVNATPGEFGSALKIPVITTNEKGLVTKVTEQDINIDVALPNVVTPGVYGSNTTIPIITLSENGIVTSVSEQEVSVSSLMSDVISPGTFGDETIIPVLTVNSKGIITNITQKQITAASILDDVITSGTFGSGTKVPAITVNEKGIITSIQEIDFTPGTELPDIATDGTFGSGTKIPVVTINKKGLVTGIQEIDLPTGNGGVLPDITTDGTFGSGTKIPVVTVNKKGLVTGVQEIDFPSSELPDITTAGNFGSDIKIPTISVNAKGLVTGVQEQSVSVDKLLPDVVAEDTFGSNLQIPVIGVNKKGIITSITSTPVDLAQQFFLADNQEERNNLPSSKRNSGMLVLTKNDNKIWQLKNDLVSWQEYIPRPSKLTVTYPIASIEALTYSDFSLNLGNSVIVYNVLVSHPCMFEVYETPARNDTNPYKFVATSDHLQDDGSTLLSDGTILRGRRYHIWSSFDNINNIYCRVSNIGNTKISNFSVSITYSPIEFSSII